MCVDHWFWVVVVVVRKSIANVCARASCKIQPPTVDDAMETPLDVLSRAATLIHDQLHKSTANKHKGKIPKFQICFFRFWKVENRKIGIKKITEECGSGDQVRNIKSNFYFFLFSVWVPRSRRNKMSGMSMLLGLVGASVPCPPAIKKVTFLTHTQTRCWSVCTNCGMRRVCQTSLPINTHKDFWYP